jgi:tetratricopeptide (TPR) repeat protein
MMVSLIPICHWSCASAQTEGTPEAQALYDKGRDAWSNYDVSGAADLFQQAVQKDPKFASGWIALGGAYYQLRKVDQAVEDWKKAAALDPESVFDGAPVLVYLASSGHADDAIAICQIAEKEEPDNPKIHDALGNFLSRAQRYPEAIAEYRKSLELKPDDAGTVEALGEAEMQNGEQEKGVADLEKSVKLDGSGFRQMLVAREFAAKKIHLDEALQYAQLAVSDQESTTAKLSLDSVTVYDFRGIEDLANSWEVLGSVEFQLGHYDRAGVYENAAAMMDFSDGERFDQLGQIYEKQGKKPEAAIAYTRSLATRGAPAAARERLDALRADGGVSSAQIEQAPSLQDLRTFQLDHFPQKPKGHTNAEFNLIFEPGPKLTSVKFVSGSEELRDAGAWLQSAKINVIFPDDHPTKILRRGILNCEPETPGCALVFAPPFSITMAQ